MSDAKKHTNRLSRETSPYLLQHAHNPVDWYPWGEEALAKSRAENKPILLSIGYSACHWCHVMEHESFEDEVIARLMNENFVNIKVDREERPDLDHIYMNAVQMMTGHGGWPLTIFLTPELKPFYGGTYFPPEDRQGMPGFPRVLLGVAGAYINQPEEIEQSAAGLLAELQRMNATRESREMLSVEMLDAALASVSRNYDSRSGGFGGAPKFPAPMTLDLLLRAWSRTRSARPLEMVIHTCRMMAEGGIYDQLGGGFHRYSTDARWLVPHFEKMLYDNAQLSRLYLHVYQATGDVFFRRVAEETLDYVVREMTDAGGGFYSTQDADSEGVEGKFFVWTPEEIEQHLGPADAALFNAYYDVTAHGNFEEANILNVRQSIEDVARAKNVSVERLTSTLERGRKVLFEVRERRIKPGRDEKILTAWNGLMMESFALAAAILERDDYLGVAERNAEFVLQNLRRDDFLLRSYKDNQAKLNGYLDDYAYLAAGLLALYEASGNSCWLAEARQVTDRMIEEFWDEEEGGFFYTGRSHEALIVRSKDFFDNATPAGNSVATLALLRLALLTGGEKYQRQAVTVFRLLRDPMTRHSAAFGYLLGALDFYLSQPLEIAIVKPAEASARELTREVWKSYLPNKVVAVGTVGDKEAASLSPLLRDRPAQHNSPTAYVCENYACQQPVTTPEELAAQLAG
ncbi:MAG TPA: thioredoxin domain-containing protein [Pyrinomonadaceae bacterium]|nr:thioredoxin domain-containing protein [Pyrinomonadaceae bacterium]